ncbi:MAG TPA: cation diffusion facilitator family transporter [Solirubrobacteraceae bacterium]|nr:cation diffusion facilitator family transporter [Solirubrobacteraceae bacterium]
MAARLIRKSSRDAPGTGSASPQHRAGESAKTAAAALSVGSNSALIAFKLVAGILTGSVAILTEALHSSIDLIASFVALFSVRKASAPADDEHRYGHYKIENLAAAIEGVLILVGSAVIIYEAIHRLIEGGSVHRLGVGIVVVGLSAAINVVVSSRISRVARAYESPALEGDAAHLRTDAATSAGVLVGLVLVQVTGASWIDAAVALAIAVAIIWSGLRLLSRSTRVLVDEGLPPQEIEAIRGCVALFGEHGVVGYHNLRTRRAGARRYIDLHVQFGAGTTLEAAHRTAHELQDAIADRLSQADVLIHLEPADRVRPGTDVPPQ